MKSNLFIMLGLLTSLVLISGCTKLDVNVEGTQAKDVDVFVSDDKQGTTNILVNVTEPPRKLVVAQFNEQFKKVGISCYWDDGTYDYSRDFTANMSEIYFENERNIEQIDKNTIISYPKVRVFGWSDLWYDMEKRNITQELPIFTPKTYVCHVINPALLFNKFTYYDGVLVENTTEWFHLDSRGCAFNFDSDQPNQFHYSGSDCRGDDFEPYVLIPRLEEYIKQELRE